MPVSPANGTAHLDCLAGKLACTHLKNYAGTDSECLNHVGRALQTNGPPGRSGAYLGAVPADFDLQATAGPGAR